MCRFARAALVGLVMGAFPAIAFAQFLPGSGELVTHGPFDGTFGAAAATLQDGRVLIVGGATNEDVVGRAYLFNPLARTGALTVAPSPLRQPRAFHAATLIQSNGKVLVTGGVSGDFDLLGETEIFDPSAGTFAAGQSMQRARVLHVSAWVPDLAKVLIAGGYDADGRFVRDWELFDPLTGQFSIGGTLGEEPDVEVPFPDTQLIAAGRQLILKATQAVYVFLPAAGTLNFVRIAKPKPLLFDSATPIDARHVLFTGGVLPEDLENETGTCATSAFVLDLTSNRFSAVNAPMLAGRCFHGSQRLVDGTILLSGGLHGSDGFLDTSEVYLPGTSTFVQGPRLSRKRFASTVVSTLGQVVLIGGGVEADDFETPATMDVFIPSAQGSLVYLDSRPRSQTGDKTPLILIHGWCSTTGTWDEFRSYFNANSGLNGPYQLWAFTFSTGRRYSDATSIGLTTIGCNPTLAPDHSVHRIQGVGLQLGRAVAKEFPSRPVALVAHSLGGLVARSFIQEAGGLAVVQRFVSLATPHHGIADDVLNSALPAYDPGELSAFGWDGVDSTAPLQANTWLRCLNGLQTTGCLGAPAQQAGAAAVGATAARSTVISTVAQGRSDDQVVRIDSGAWMPLVVPVASRWTGLACASRSTTIAGRTVEHVAVKESTCRVTQWQGTWAPASPFLNPPPASGNRDVYDVIAGALSSPGTSTASRR